MQINIIKRIVRHFRISWKKLCIPNPPSPPFLTLFINSACNLKCEHCFYWKDLNNKNDLTVKEIFSLSNELGRIENLYLSGGEPFIRKEFSEICRYFIRNNYVQYIYVPSNAYYTERTVESIREVLKEPCLKLFVIEISLDGMPEFHNNFRGSKRSFQNALRTYDSLVSLQKKDPRLRIHAISTVNSRNLNEIRDLTSYLYERCTVLDHHNIAMIRGNRKNPTLKCPDLLEYQKLVDYVEQLWRPREKKRFGSIMEPLLQWAKVSTEKNKRQVVPCSAGVLNATIYADGSVGVCEEREPIGNLRQKSFKEIWYSKETKLIRNSIRRKECYCTNVIFLYPSIAFHPWFLIKALFQSRIWKKRKDTTNREKELLPNNI